MEAAIEINQLDVVRGGRQVLRGVDTAITQGSVTGLLGPSGSGKSTIMRCIVGVQLVRSGTVRVLGEPAGSSLLRDKVGYLTQAPSVYADLTVRENARYFASLYGIDGSRADEVLEQVGLEKQADQLVGSLSGGQHSRASLACALVSRPEVMVLDEPTVGQDPVLREELWRVFRRLAEDGATVLVSSHVMDEATRCDRLLLIREGAILADDTPDGVRERAGTHDLDKAFLTLVQEQQQEEVA